MLKKKLVKKKTLLIVASLFFFVSGLLTLIIYFATKKSVSGGSNHGQGGVGSQTGIFGNWIYGYVPTSLYASIKSHPMTDYLPPAYTDENGIFTPAQKENAVFYLGPGTYPTHCSIFGCWNVNKLGTDNGRSPNGIDFDKLDYQVINFGGWGSCPAAKPINGSKIPYKGKVLPHSYCNTGGPNIVWYDEVLDKNLPTKAQIFTAGFNSVSLDIEGVAQDLFTGGALNTALKLWGGDSSDPGLTRFITIPGNGIKDKFGGTKWLVDVDPKNYEYLVLMYYGAGADTVKTDGTGGGGLSAIISSLEGWINGGGPVVKGVKPWPTMPAIDSKKIIIGFSFSRYDSIDTVNKYLQLYNTHKLGGCNKMGLSSTSM